MITVVYRSKDNWFFSDAVKREFGENHVIKDFCGNKIICAVMPLKVEPLPNNLELFGIIVN